MGKQECEKGELPMNTAQPIRNRKDLANLKSYYSRKEPNLRNHLLVIIGLNTALRISDILELRWRDVYDSGKSRFEKHITIAEQKTGKRTEVFINENIRNALVLYREEQIKKKREVADGQYLFEGRKNTGRPISRVQAHRIIKEVAENCGISGVVSCHSLRKTFGYYAWQQGVSPVMLMNIYNHSSFIITQRYLGIEQDDRDKIFREIVL